MLHRGGILLARALGASEPGALAHSLLRALCQPAAPGPLPSLRSFSAGAQAGVGGFAAQPALRQAASLPLPGLSPPHGLPRWPLLAWRRSVATVKHKVKFAGGKVKQYSRWKERFFTTASGEIRSMRSGHRHKRFVKGHKRNRELRQSRSVHSTYANTMKKLGFKSRTFC